MRRISGGKILGIVAAAMALAFGSLWLWFRSAESRRWEEVGRLVEELSVEAATRDVSRPVLRGDPVPGDAWKLYGPLLAEAAAGTPRADWKAAAVESLRRGVRRGSAGNPYALESVPMMSENAVEFGQMTLLQALGEAEAGRRRQAAELMLDVGMYARDLGHNGNFGLQHASFTLLNEVADELLKLLRSMGSDRETPAQIARELEILDRALGRSGYVVLNELAREARALRTSEQWEWWGYDISDAGWRHAFSRRLMAAEGVSRLVAWTRRHLDDDEAQGSKREDFFWEECAGGGNGLLVVAARREDLWAADGRFVHARLHLLRLAAHFLATGEVLSIADPYGVHLLHQVQGPHLKAWRLEKAGPARPLEIEVTR